MHITNGKLGKSTPVHDLAIVLESCDSKPSVTKLASVPPHIDMNATTILAMNIGMTL